MEQQNYITVEMTFKLQMKDYRIVLGVKRLWIMIGIVSLLKIITWLIDR